MKKILAIILSTVILSNFAVGSAFAQEPKTEVTNEVSQEVNKDLPKTENDTKKSKQSSAKDLLKQELQKLNPKEKKINSLKQKLEKKNKPILDEIKKIENMSDKEYKTNLFRKRLKIFVGSAIALCCVGLFKDKVLFSLNWLRGFIGGLLIPDVIKLLTELAFLNGKQVGQTTGYQAGYLQGYKEGSSLNVDSSFLDSLKNFKSVAYKLINPSNIKPLNKSEVTSLSSALNSLLDSCPKNM